MNEKKEIHTNNNNNSNMPDTSEGEGRRPCLTGGDEPSQLNDHHRGVFFFFLLYNIREVYAYFNF